MTAPRSFRDTVAVQAATLLGAGRSPFVPGTVGTLAALPFAVAAWRYLPLWGFLAVATAVAAFGIWASELAAEQIGQKDPGAVVIDEAAGIMVTLLGVPFGWGAAAGAFFLFRVMDVLKPPPAARAELLPGGWGIMTDDLIAGLYANIALRAALWIVSALRS